MRSTPFLLRGLIALLLLAAPLRAFAAEVDFAHEVLPILKQHCAKCHSGDRKEGGLAMNTREQLLAGGENGEVVAPGDAAKSELLRRVTSDDDGVWMPPEGPRLTAKEVATLTKWINAGLPWEPGVTIGKSAWEPPLKPRHVELPPAINGRNHPIDRLLDADLSQHKESLPPSVSDAQFMRRASLDAVGLLPTPKQLQAFTQDRSNDKRQRYIDELLTNDIAYADHWLTMWNDLLRNDYTGTGFITGGRKQVTSWLYASLRDNKPYDQMVRELIAPTADSAGFIDGIQWRGDVNASQTREIQFAQNISQVFLGINMKCASCHDSFIDRWKLAEAYNLAAIYADKTLELHRCDKPTGTTATPKWIFPEIGDVDPQASKPERLKQLAELMTHPDNGRTTRTLVNRLWHRLMGRGIVHPVDAMHTQPWNEDLLDYLAVRFAEDGYDLRKFLRFVMTSQAYQSRTAVLESAPGEDYAYAGPLAKRMTAEQFIDCVWQITQTHPAKPTAKVDREVRKPVPTEKLQHDEPDKPVSITAKWIWHPDKGTRKTTLRKRFQLESVPNVARMMATCDNAFTMRINGAEVASSKDWQKPVYRDVAHSLMPGENLIEVDAEMFGGASGFICQINGDQKQPLIVVTDNTWEAQIPDADWATAIELHTHGNGPWGAVLNPTAKPSAASDTPPVRAALVQNDFLMRSLGRPHRDQVVTTRPSELTTLQAIDLANGDILAGYLQSGAQRIVRQGRSSQELIDWLYRFSLSREPTEAEQAVLLEMIGDGRDPKAVEDLLWTIFMLPEFQMVR